jgi:ABC-2 type transport system ATP-binding protein
MIEVNHLSRYYGEFAALEDVSFKAQEGQIVGLLGKNGAGKSTTLKILAGLIPPSDGSVSIDGIDIIADPHRVRSRIGYLPEDPPLYVDMTVRDFVTHIGELKGMSTATVRQRLPDVLATTQLTDRADQVIDTLSHGYRKRVGIAQAIIHDPRLVILDEPISGLDPEQIVEMRAVIKSLSASRAVLVSSHILTEVQQVCDYLLVIRDGRLVRQGNIAELSRPVLRVVVRGEAAAFHGWIAEQTMVDSARKLGADDGISGAFAGVEVTLSSDAREQLAADLIRAGFGLRSMSDEGSLERAFLGLATGEA